MTDDTEVKVANDNERKMVGGRRKREANRRRWMKCRRCRRTK